MPRKKNRGRTFTELHRHKKQKNLLVPPLASNMNLQPVSWMDERLPELLWAVLLLSRIVREDAIEAIRRVGKLALQIQKDQVWDITHTGLAASPPEFAREVISTVTSTPGGAEAVAPLLLFEDLPARGLWLEGIQLVLPEWTELMEPVGNALWHQSQLATDCRWARVLFHVAAGRLHVPADQFDLIANYPYQGDLRMVRPLIRATEIALNSLRGDANAWPSNFWGVCLRMTPCAPVGGDLGASTTPIGTTLTNLETTWAKLVSHYHSTALTTAVDAKHEAVFGGAFFCLALLLELLRPGASRAISARLQLRTILEVFITLSYLFEKGQGDLWQSYRVYGAGQAKLAFLKLAAGENDLDYVSIDDLQSIANEDMWQEFTNINVGHWANSDLRRMSGEAHVKDEYDAFYPWLSTYSHGHWGAMRDSIFTVCGNPLHRLHRVPRESARTLNDVLGDACKLTDKVLALVSKAYPSFDVRVAVTSTANV